MIWNQTDVRLDPNQLENGKYNLNSVWFNKISKIFLCVCTNWTVSASAQIDHQTLMDDVKSLSNQNDFVNSPNVKYNVKSPNVKYVNMLIYLTS